MFNTQHQEGPGCTTFLADAALLQAFAEIMESNYQQVIVQSVTALNYANQMADAIVSMGDIDAKKAIVDASLKMIGATIGAVFTIGATAHSLSQTAPIVKLNKSTENIHNTLEKLQKAPGENAGGIIGKMDGKPTDKTQPIKIDTAGRPEKIKEQLKTWCAEDCKTAFPKEIKFKDSCDFDGIPLPGASEREYSVDDTALSLLPKKDKQEMITMLKNKESELTSKKEEYSRKISAMTNIGMLGKNLTDLIEAISGPATADLTKDRASLDAAKNLITQNQEYVKQAENITVQGITNAVESLKKILQEFEQVVTANTRV